LGTGFVVTTGSADGESTIGAATVFVNDYGDCDRLPPNAGPGAHHWLTGFLDPARARLVGITLGNEELSGPAELADVVRYSAPEATIVYLAQGETYPSDGGRPYRIHSVDYNPGTGYFSVELYLPLHWLDTRVYVTVVAEVLSGVMAPAMTQVINVVEEPDSLSSE
jgi:hypothetical protein